jgi:hypothetical protein
MLAIWLVWWVTVKYAGQHGILDWKGFGKNGTIFFFWFAYVISRPTGASLGDLFGRNQRHHGIGLGVEYTSIILFVICIVIISYLTYTKMDLINAAEYEEEKRKENENETNIQMTAHEKEKKRPSPMFSA